VLPGIAAARSGGIAAPGCAGRACAVRPVTLSPAGEGVAAASEDRADGRARAAAHVTAIEEARCPRMPLILDIV
jgi:hypothetical protein